eukprot:gene11593-12787_t
MKNFENYKTEAIERCLCYDNCAKLCDCSPSCTDWATMRLKPEKIEVTKAKKMREVYMEQKNQLEMLLEEYRKILDHSRMISLPITYSEFNALHINQVLSSSQNIFSLQDVYDHVEIWRNVYAVGILSILKTGFEVIVEDVAFAGLPDFDQSMHSLQDEWVNIRHDSEAEDLNVGYFYVRVVLFC